MLAKLERKENQELLRKLAKDIDKKTAIEIAMELKKGDKGEPGYTPVKGKDYFTEEELGKIAAFVKDGLKEEVTPVKGRDYFDGEDGRHADESKMIEKLRSMIPTVEEIVANVKLPEMPVFDEAILTQRIISQMPKPEFPTIEEIVNEIKKKKLLELRDIRGARLDSPQRIDMNDMRWHGGGLSNITGLITAGTNITITGSGTASDPYVINAGAGGGESLAQTLVIGNVTGGNDIIVSTGDVIKGQTDLTLQDSTGDNFYYASSSYIFQQWYNGVITDFLLQGGGTQLYSDTAIDIQSATGLYGFFGGTTPSGTLDFTALTMNRSYAFPDASGTLALTSQLPTPAALTRVDDTNVTLTLGGTPSTALLQATSLTLGWTGQLSLARGGTGANLSDPGANKLWGWDDTDNSIGFWVIGGGLSYDHATHTLSASGTPLSLEVDGTPNGDQTLLNLISGTGITLTDDGLGGVTIDASGTPISFGTVGQIPFMNAGGTDFDYSASISFNGARMLLTGAGTGQVGALHINRGDSVNQYIVLQESGASAGSAYLTFAGSNPGAMAMGALFTAGVPTSYVFTDTGGVPLVSIDEATGNFNIANLTASEIVATDGSKNLQSLAVATYPSLLELSYVKGVTSAIQTQINAKGAIAGQVWTGVHDFSGATSLSVPVSAAPTVNADGEIAFDTTVADFSTGVMRFYGNEEQGIVAMPIAQFTAPQSGYVVTYNATNDEFELAAPAGGVPTTITVANEATDTSCFIAFFTAATGDLGPKTNVNMTFNSNTGVATFASVILTTADINGGTIDGTVIGGASPAAVTSTIVVVDNITIDLNTISSTSGNLNLTPVAGSAIVLDGTISVDAGVVTGITSLGVTGTRVTAGFFVDLTVTNAIAGSITGNAATVTVANEATDTTCFIGFFTDASGSLAPKTNVNMTFNSNTGVATFASTVLTTTDINGGTIDGTIIGGASAAAGTFTTHTSNNLLAASNDVGAIGASGTAWSDLFLASGGIINWNAGNATITHSAGLLTSNVDIAVPDEAYGVGWNGSLEVPTKNATYDKIETLMANPMTTGGDIIYGGASGLPTRLANGVSEQFLGSNGSTNAPSWQYGEIWDFAIELGSDFVVTNNGTLQDVTGFTFAATAGRAYLIKVYGCMQFNNTTGKSIHALVNSGTWDNTESNYNGAYYNTSGTLTALAVTAFTSTTVAVQLTTGGSANHNYSFRVEYQANVDGSGNIKYQIANLAASAGRTSTLKAGAVMLVRRIA